MRWPEKTDDTISTYFDKSGLTETDRFFLRCKTLMSVKHTLETEGPQHFWRFCSYVNLEFSFRQMLLERDETLFQFNCTDQLAAMTEPNDINRPCDLLQEILHLFSLLPHNYICMRKFHLHLLQQKGHWLAWMIKCRSLCKQLQHYVPCCHTCFLLIRTWQPGANCYLQFCF